jgi:hypothetical protein
LLDATKSGVRAELDIDVADSADNAPSIDEFYAKEPNRDSALAGYATTAVFSNYPDYRFVDLGTIDL